MSGKTIKTMLKRTQTSPLFPTPNHEKFKSDLSVPQEAKQWINCSLLKGTPHKTEIYTGADGGLFRDTQNAIVAVYA